MCARIKGESSGAEKLACISKLSINLNKSEMNVKILWIRVKTWNYTFIKV